jgi:hypothetical protein
VTAHDLRRAVAGYPEAAVRAAVEAGLRECPFEHLPNESGFGALVTCWLVDPESFESLPPPLTEDQIATVHRHLVASTN